MDKTRGYRDKKKDEEAWRRIIKRFCAEWEKMGRPGMTVEEQEEAVQRAITAMYGEKSTIPEHSLRDIRSQVSWRPSHCKRAKYRLWSQCLHQMNN